LYINYIKNEIIIRYIVIYFKKKIYFWKWWVIIGSVSKMMEQNLSVCVKYTVDGRNLAPPGMYKT